MSLYEHQRVGAAWLAARARGYLGDRPGLGKTRTLLAGLNGDVSSALIVCPAIVRTHWQREAASLGYDNRSALAPIVKSYDEITRGGNALMADLLVRRRVNALVLDEAHYLKHSTSKRAVQLLGRDGYARRLPRVYAASGTPVPKNPSELWTTLASLFPEVAVEHGLKSIEDFIARFCTTRGGFVRGKWIEKVLADVRNADEFRAILAKIMLARTLDDVGLDVPALDWQTTRLDGAGDGLVFSESGYVRAALEAGTLAEIANDPHIARMRRRLGELKVTPTEALIRGQLEDSDEKLVIFAHHRSVLGALYDTLETDDAVIVHGDTSQKDRDRAIDRFQTDPKVRLFFGQNIACQTGITLTAARRVFLVEPDWTAVVNDQLGHRVARIGQTAERCIAHMIALAGTLDEAIINRNIQEVRMAAAIGLGE